MVTGRLSTRLKFETASDFKANEARYGNGTKRGACRCADLVNLVQKFQPAWRFDEAVRVDA